MGVLEGKTALISGASSGIGRAAARLFASEGARLVVTARRGAELEKLVGEIEAAGGQARAVAGDVRDPGVHRAAVEAALGDFGTLDIAFNNAGSLGEQGPATAISAEGWQETLDINLTAGFHAAQAQLPALIEARGSMIFTSTFVGHVLGFPGMAAYGAAKAGLVGLMRVLAVETAEQGVRVNAILPGGVATPMGIEGAGSEEGLAMVRGLHAMRRIAEPEEIAEAALFLASDRSSFMTGTTLTVDGGITVTRT